MASGKKGQKGEVSRHRDPPAAGGTVSLAPSANGGSDGRACPDLGQGPKTQAQDQSWNWGIGLG